MKLNFVFILLTIFVTACTPSRDVVMPEIAPPLMEPKADQSGILSIDDVFSGKYQMEYFGGVQWSQDGESFTQIENSRAGNSITETEVATNEKSTFISANELKPKDADQPLRVSKYFLSEDEQKLMIFTNTRRVWRENTKGDYWVLDLKTNELRQIGKELPASSLMFAKFSKDASKVAYVSGHNLYVENLSNGKIKALTKDGTEDIINGTFDWAYEEELFCKDGFRWSPDGKTIAFWQIDASDIGDYLMINTTDSIYPFTIPVEYPKAGKDPSSAKIGIVDVSTGGIKWAKIPGDPSQNYLPRLQWINDNMFMAHQLNRKQNTFSLWSCNASTGEANLFYTEKDDAWTDVVHMDVSAPWEMLDLPFFNNSLYKLTEKDGWRHLYKLPLNRSEEVLITKFEHDVARYYTLNGENRPGYVCASPDNATQRYLYSVDVENGSTPQRLTPPQYSGVNTYDVSPNGKYAIHSHSSSTQAPSVHLITLPDHKILETYADNKSYMERLQKEVKMPIVEFFKVTTEDGVEMDGKMLKPYNFDPKKKYPVIFNVYGEPAGQTAVDTWSPNLLSAMFTQKGYIYITMDNRGTPSLKGREWRKSIYRKVGVINSRDQAMATKKIRDWEFVDEERIAVWGWSGGGSMTLNLLFRYPEIYQTGVSVAAVANQLYYDNIYQERYMGLPSENMEDFVEGSPITYAKNLQGNLLYIHGTADDNVHYQNAEALINELVKHNKQFDLMSYPGRSHGIWEGEGTTKHLYTMLTNYFLEHCPPGGRQPYQSGTTDKSRS